jgi:putative DNA primase/helicase
MTAAEIGAALVRVAPPGCARSVTALDIFTDESRWVAWRFEDRGGKATKVPYSPKGGRARADEPATWGTRAQAHVRVAKIVGESGGGIGIELGDLGGDTHLGGIDLDSCLSDNGGLATWAEAILEVVQSYTEVSPSGLGLKVFFCIASEDVRPFLELNGIQDPEQWGFKRAIGEDASDHGPAVEIYLARRYFTVTGDRWMTQPDQVTLLDWPTLEHLAQLIAPARAGKPGADNSRSAIAFRKGAALRRAGKTFEEMCAALRADPETAEWVREKGEINGGRELRRIWDKAVKSIKVVPGPDDAIPPEYSDEALALRFSDKHACESRYIASWGKWLRWTGTRWLIDDTMAVFSFARAICRVASAELLSNQRAAVQIASAKTVAAVEKLARADRRHAETVCVWDADPWLLNTPGGIVDLRNRNMVLHDPAQYMTKITAVAPEGDCPLWRKFLAEITGNDDELQGFLQRFAGYSLTGSILEHALFFFYGTGTNGKGVFLNTLTAVLADYAAVAPMEAFVVTQGERHPTDLAGLRGAGLVTAQETERGRRWAESKVKALTGGDPITARLMHQDFFTYMPTFKLAIAGNHKPSLSGVNAAIRRRLHLIPFTVTIAKPDKKLPEKLRPEWPGILQWVIDGCLQWQREGLNPPNAVREATDAYLAQEDSFSQWVEDCCVVGRNRWGIGQRLWQSWKTWAEVNNEPAGTRKSFADMVIEHGYLAEKSQHVRGYAGIDLKPPPDRDPLDFA